ncbi:MAG: Gfo/Idh/MocA family protein [Candidatus Dormibacteria bacterium]
MSGTRMDAIRVGVIGLGWAGQTHVEAYHQVPGVEVTALAGLESDELSRLGSAYHVRLITTDPDEVLAADDVDAVSICLPNYMHAPIAIRALESGKHVLCEKPMATNADDAASIVAAAERCGKVVRTVFNWRARDDVRRLSSLAAAGRLGRVYHARASWTRRSGIPGIDSWFTRKSASGGGVLIDLGVHVLDLALHLLGEPEPLTVSAYTHNELGSRGVGGGTDAKMGMLGRFDVEDMAGAMVRLSGGASLMLETSWAGYQNARDEVRVALYGTEGGAEITVSNYAWEETLEIFGDDDGDPVTHRPMLTTPGGHREVVTDFIAAIRGGGGAADHGHDGLRRARIIDACYQSAAAGREVVLAAAAPGPST